MKKKLTLILMLSLILSCLFVISVSAQVTTYDDAPERVKLTVSTDDVVVFSDGFTCPTCYVFQDYTQVNPNNSNGGRFADYFDFTYINGKRLAEDPTHSGYTFADIERLDLPQGLTYVGLYSGKELTTLKSISFPNTITGLGNAIFENATGLEECVFEWGEGEGPEYLPAYMFFGCSSLKAFSMPDSITTIKTFTFTRCSSLSAVHISNNLKTIEGRGGGYTEAGFDGCGNVYFVNEPFGKGEIPEKPEVYYFPSTLENTFSNTIFRNCYNLNSILVFGEKVTEMPTSYLWQGCKNVSFVFLGNMTSIDTNGWGTATIYFANENDLSADDVTISGSKTTIFCNNENNNAHLYKVDVNTAPTCTEDGVTGKACFCGAVDTLNAVIVPKKGHNVNSEQVDIYYESFIVSGYSVYFCPDCEQRYNALEADCAPIFVSKGYSCTVYDNMISIVQGFDVNREALSAYTAFEGNSISYGVVATSVNKVSDGNIDVVNKVDGVTAIDFTAADKKEFTRFEIKVADIAEANQDTGLYACAYVIADGEVYYISENESTTVAIAKSAATILQENPI